MSCKLKFLFISVLLAFIPHHAVADFELAMQHYEKGDYENAYHEFEKAAQSGNYASQFNLGVMYYQGQFVEKNVYLGYAWLALAAQYALFEEKGLYKKVYEGFSEKQKQLADEAYEDLLAKFGDSALRKALEPVFLGVSPTSERLRLKKKVVPTYPRTMSRRGKNGWVDVFYTVAKDGTTRDHVVYYSSHKHFTEATLKALRASIYEPELINGESVAVNGIKMRYLFNLDGVQFDETRIKKFLQEAKEAAEQGGANDKLEYGYLLETLPSYTGRHDLFKDNPNQWYHSAAQSGSGAAGFFLGRNLLYGNKCEADPDKSYVWLVKAAETVTDAQYTLALELLSGVRFEKDVKKALYWLERAASSGNANAMLKYAWVLSTTKDDSLRNAEEAATLFEKVDKNHPDRQTYFEVAAAVAAENGNFESAQKWQKKALEDAESLELPREAVVERLSEYKNNRPLRVAL